MQSSVDRGAIAGVSTPIDSNPSGVSWAAVLAGAAAAAALSYILIVLGFGLGFSAVSPYSGSGASATSIGVATIVWLALTQIISAGMGGYLAGRLRSRWVSVHTDEVYFRDTAHGFLSWAVASLVVAAFLANAIGGIVSGGASVAGAAASGIGTAATAAAGAAAGKITDGDGGADGYFVDSLFRGTPPAAGTQTADKPANNGEAARILAQDLGAGALPPPDKQYLGQLVSQRTGLAQPEAEQRVDATFAAMKQASDSAKAKAKEAADMARKAAAGLALWLFVSLLCGAFAGSFFATYGGRRRDSDAVLARPINRPL